MKGLLASRRAVLLVLVSACGHAPTGAPASVAPSASGAAPAELRVPGLDEHRGAPMFLADRIYVFGRSETGIAYLIEPADEACGCYQPAIVVQDLRTGEIAWKDSYDSGELAPADPSQLQNLEQLWRAHGADWERHLVAHGITREPALALATLPVGGTSVPRFELHTEQVDASSPEDYAHLTSYRVDLVSASGTTTIARSSAPERDLLAVDLPGFVAARGDGPAAVLVQETRRGWEGPPSVHRLRLVGADLHVGPR